MAHLSTGDWNTPLRGQAMTSVDLVHEAGLGLVVENGVITKIRPSEEIEAEYGREGSISLNNRAIIPGLVDAHTHLLWGGDRSAEMKMRQQGMSYTEISEMGGGIKKTVQSTRSLSNTDLFALGKSRLSKSLQNGTTSIEIKSGYGLDTDNELRLLEVGHKLKSESNMELSLTWLGAHDTPPGGDRSDYVEEIISEQLPAIVSQGFAKSADVFCEPGWFTIDETEEICQASKNCGLEIRLHVDEFSDGGGLALAAELGAITADHAAHSSEEARALADKAGTIQGFLPGTPYVLGSDHWPPVKRTMENEWAWYLASDFNPNCHSLSLPMVGSLVTHRMGVDPLAALVAVSRNPATTFQRDDGLAHGIIAEGAAANLNVLWGTEIDGWCQTPGQSPFTSTMLDGKIIKHD